ncbi:hypothetical protein [Herbaspirillum seropedicae]|jgi:hypothetical protein|uniref:hypothetical protein n=1 Tax=Herbaspirillum seropedicae TaxID=964 RepID=UPI000863BA9C|nr:hypothetical protein [Herbaspirillum seropedicae]AON55644.1 hypothetical protein Hsc_3376 [Herbaspirillum seropedicae]
MKKIKLMLPMIALFGGCAAPYQPPSSGDTSNVSFVPMLPGTVFVFIHQGDDVKTCTNGKQVARLKNGEKTSALLPAGEKIVLHMRQMQMVGLGAMTCDAAAEFVPESGRNYVFTLGRNGQCIYSVRDDKGPIRMTKREVTPSAISNDTSWCKPVAD